MAQPTIPIPIGSNHRLSRADFEPAVKAGAFEADAELEQLDGDLCARTAEGRQHAVAVELLAECLAEVFGGPEFRVRTHRPLALDDYSEPEPDVAVVTDALRGHREAHPGFAFLVVEVGHESLHRDRTVQRRLYARRGIPEYWVLSLPDARPEVHREPDDQDAYLTVTPHGAGDTIAPIARPQARGRVQDLLPLTVERAGVHGASRGLPPEARDRHDDSTPSRACSISRSARTRPSTRRPRRPQRPKSAGWWRRCAGCAVA